MDILEQLGDRTFRADTAINSLLPALARCPEELNLTHPDLVRQAHADAIAAGARLVRTNSYAASSPALATLGLADHVNEITWCAAQIARQAATGTGAFIAGRVGPLDSSTPPANRRGIFKMQIGALLDGKVDLICLEGFTDLTDLVLAIEIKHELHHCPVLASVASLPESLRSVTAAEPDILGFDGLELADVLDFLRTVRSDLPVAVFPRLVAPESDSYQIAGINP